LRQSHKLSEKYKVAGAMIKAELVSVFKRWYPEPQLEEEPPAA